MKLVKWASLGIILDFLFTRISFLLCPSLALLLEANNYIVQSQWYIPIIISLFYLFMLHHAIKIKSRLYIFIWTGLCFGLRTFAILSHPVFWLWLVKESVNLQLVGMFFQGSLAILAWTIAFLYENDKLKKEKAIQKIQTEIV